MSDLADRTESIDFSDKEKLEMLENWFQKRTQMTSKALRLILIPIIAVLVFALAFWFQYYIPVPTIVLLGVLGGALLAWVICLIIGSSVLKKVRVGDSIMLRKIRSSGTAAKS